MIRTHLLEDRVEGARQREAPRGLNKLLVAARTVLRIVRVIEQADVRAVRHLHDARRHKVVEEERDGTTGDCFIPAVYSSGGVRCDQALLNVRVRVRAVNGDADGVEFVPQR